jgi:hypothetical protein
MNILSLILSLLPIFIVLVLLIWRKMAAALAAPSCAFFKGSAGCNLAHLFYNYGVLHKAMNLNYYNCGCFDCSKLTYLCKKQ